MKRLLSMASLAAMLTFAVDDSEAAIVSLSFDSLPSAQGWTYSATGTPAAESSVFSVNGTTLTQSTIGIGIVGQATNLYQLLGFIDPNDAFTVEMTVRVTQSEGSAGAGPFGFGVFIRTGDYQYSLGIDTSTVVASTSTGVVTVNNSIDTTLFHDYRIEGGGGGPMRVYIDNNLEFTGTPVAVVATDGIFLGDGTGGQNSTAEVTSFTFSQVPEPSRAILGALGLGVMLLRRRARS